MQSTNTFELARYGADLKHRIHDMPIGDPLAGAPYGEYLKSKGLGMVLGVFASVATMGAAMPLMAAGASLASQIAGGVMMAGGVLSGVGAVTGNKKLSKTGGIMSLAGGVGALAIGVTGGASGAVGQSLGSGSDALATMSSSFMDSAKSVSGGLLYSDQGANAAKGASEIAVDAPADVAGTINPDNISNGPPAASAAPTPDPTIKLPEAANPKGTLTLDSTQTAVDQSTQLGAAGPTGVPLEGTAVQPVTAPPAPGDGLKFSANDPNAGVINKELTKGGGDSLLKDTNKFLGDNKELLKTGANALEMGVKYGMGGDAADAQMAEALNRAKVYDAQAALLTTQNAQAQFQLANQNKKSVMLSANDPELDKKLAKAKAEGAAIGIIPTFGGGGVQQAPGAQFGNSAQMANAQQVVRPSTYTQPTVGILNKAA